MKMTVIGSHLCPDTLYALGKLSGAGMEVDFRDTPLLPRRAAELSADP